MYSAIRLIAVVINAFVPGTRMDELLKEALGTVTLKKTGKGGGGCINEGEAYLIDTGTVFVKYNKKPQVNQDSWKLLF
jgi:fructosamine-3-kinase